MSRTTSTRELVHAAATRLVEQGVDPTPTLVRKLLGKGSPNVIVDELRKWRAAQPTAAPAPALSSAEALQQIGQAELADHLLQVSRLAEELGGLRTVLAAWTEQATALLDEMRAERAVQQDRLQALSIQFESMQRYALLSIEAAREETRRYKELAQERIEELANWRQVAQDAMRHSSQAPTSR